MARYAGLAVLLVFLVCFYVQVESLRRKRIAVIPLTGMASWYPAAADTAGDLSCAMRSADFGKMYRVCNAETGACVLVRHTEWGPSWQLFRQGRIIDLSKEAFLRIADLNRGVIRVTVTREEKTVEGDGKTGSR